MPEFPQKNRLRVQPSSGNHGAYPWILVRLIIERLWRSLKYECVFLNAFGTGSSFPASVHGWRRPSAVDDEPVLSIEVTTSVK
jgi:hypothetical protein